MIKKFDEHQYIIGSDQWVKTKKKHSNSTHHILMHGQFLPIPSTNDQKKLSTLARTMRPLTAKSPLD